MRTALVVDLMLILTPERNRRIKCSSNITYILRGLKNCTKSRSHYFLKHCTSCLAFVFVFCSTYGAFCHPWFPSVSLSHRLVCWNKAECWNSVIISLDWCSILSCKQLAYSILQLRPSENDWCNWPALSTGSVIKAGRDVCHRVKQIILETFLLCYLSHKQVNSIRKIGG